MKKVFLFYSYQSTKVTNKNLAINIESLTSVINDLNQQIYSETPKIVIFGDTRNGDEVHKKIVSDILTEKPIAVFNVGDLVNDGKNKNLWKIFNQIELPLIKSTNYYVTAGNHEKESALYYNNFELPGNEKWYSVNYEGIHFTVLNSNLDLSAKSPQYRWLISDLKTVSPSIKYKAFVIHQSIYTSAKHNQDKSKFKENLLPIIKKYKINMVFSGHDHDYEKSFNKDTYYFVCGAAGAPLYQKEFENPYSKKFVSSPNYCVVQNIKGSLSVKAFNDKRELIDETTLNPN